MKRRIFIQTLFGIAALTALPSLGPSALGYSWMEISVNGVTYKIPVFDN